jgi:hypothetical protein
VNYNNQGIFSKVNWIYVDPALMPMYRTWTAADGEMKSLAVGNTNMGVFPLGSFEIDRGDGQTETVSASATTVNHTYTTAGDYTVTIPDPSPLLFLNLGISQIGSLLLGGESHTGQGVTDFRGGIAPELQYLFLGHNQLSPFSSGALQGLGNLMALDLGANGLTSFDGRILPETLYLYLFLGDNKLSTYPDFAWERHMYSYIFLDHNRLMHLPIAELSGSSLDPNVAFLQINDNCIGRTQEEENEV